MKRLLWLLLLFAVHCPLLAVHCLAQTVTVTSTNLRDGGTLACPTATTGTCVIYWAPVTASGLPTPYRSGSGGQGTATPIGASVINGVSSIALPDSCYATPTYLCWRVTLLTSNGASLLGTCVQPSAGNYWFAAGVDNFDNWQPNGPALSGSACSFFAISTDGMQIAQAATIAVSVNTAAVASVTSITSIYVNGSVL